MAISEAALQSLADLVQTNGLAGDAQPQPGIGVADRIMRLLCNARADDYFWRELHEWCARTQQDVDLEAFRNALPGTAQTPRVPPAEYFASLGLPQAEVRIILDSIREQARRQIAIREAFENDNPAATARALEKLVDGNDPGASRKRRLTASGLSVHCLVIAALIAPHLLGVQTHIPEFNDTVAAYKGVTP